MQALQSMGTGHAESKKWQCSEHLEAMESTPGPHHSALEQILDYLRSEGFYAAEDALVRSLDLRASRYPAAGRR